MSKLENSLVINFSDTPIYGFDLDDLGLSSWRRINVHPHGLPTVLVSRIERQIEDWRDFLVYVVLPNDIEIASYILAVIQSALSRYPYHIYKNQSGKWHVTDLDVIAMCAYFNNDHRLTTVGEDWRGPLWEEVTKREQEKNW